MSTLRKTATDTFIILSGHFKLMYIISYAYSETETVFLSCFHSKIEIQNKNNICAKWPIIGTTYLNMSMHVNYYDY